jgi:predicted dehydrogenase
VIRIAVLGYGYWGPNLARNIADHPDYRLVAIADPDPERLALAGRRYPDVDVVTDPAQVLARGDIDAVAIATPPSTHYPLALEALQQGKHVLVEKPLAETSGHCARLIDEAERRKLTLMVDHIFVYTQAVRKIHELVAQPEFGDILYYDSVRANLGLFQSDVNVLWDLAVHDLSIINHVLPANPVAVSATGMRHFEGVENTAYLTVFFDRPVIAHVGVNWLAPVKIRQVMVCGRKRMIVYDEVEPSEKVKVYDRGVEVDRRANPESARKILISYRTGDVWAPHLEHIEALKTLFGHFAECVANGQRPLSGGEAGLRVVKVLEAAEQSLRHRGQPVEISAGTVNG